MKICTVYKLVIFAIFLGSAVFSGIFVLVNNEEIISKCSGKKLNETISKESLLEEIKDFHDSYVIQKVNLQDYPINSQAYWDDSENFVIDIINSRKLLQTEKLIQITGKKL